jgi:signal-transduction protein with cAMP-binding, CBS, and nucleotidyltransferase domain
MKYLISAKGRDITSWRAAEQFSATYLQSLLDRASAGEEGTSEQVYARSLADLERCMTTHESDLEQLDRLLAEGATAPPVRRMRELTGDYFEVLYHHLNIFHSAPVFYRKSMEFLGMLSGVVIAQAKDQLGLFARHLPQMALIAVGPAGRCEFTPFCQLQLLLVYEETEPSHLQTINLFCHTLHAGFEAVGLSVDQAISPRNPEWRGSLPDWQQRCHDGLNGTLPEDLINVLRLADSSILTPDEELGQNLKEMVFSTLKKDRPAQANLVERMESLSNGLGIMGRLKLEKSGAGRGLFRLLDHGLLPLSSALSALALIKESPAIGSCDRILDLLNRREVDVDLAEKMLDAWYTLHELRLRHEQALRVTEHSEQSLFLNPGELSAEQRQSLKTALTAVASIQRHVAIIFSGTGA